MEKEMIKETKYSNRGPINMDDIPISDTNLALVEFSKGSNGLAICLRVMWQHGLKTYASYPGSNNVFDIGYIIMAEDEDVFSYLSEDVLRPGSGIFIDVIDNRQRIKFIGNEGEKSSEMISIAQSIISGKKSNSKLVEEKIGEQLPTGWVRRLKTYAWNEECTYWSGKVYIK